MERENKNQNLKIFFIKLASIALAVVIVVNVLFNLLIADKFKSIDMFLSISELDTRRELGNELRDNIESLLEKDTLIKESDKILIYKFYQKIKSEFNDLEVKN